MPAGITLPQLELTEQLYLRCVPTRQIIRALGEKFKLKPGAIKRRLRKVRERLAALPRPEPAVAKARVEALLFEAAEMAREEGGAKGASAMCAIATRLGELDGVFAPQRVQLEGKGGGPIELASLTPDERRARIAELLAKRDADRPRGDGASDSAGG